MLGVEWWYCVSKFLVDRYDKAILTRVSPILLHCLCVEATHIVVYSKFLDSGVMKGVRKKRA